MASFFLCWKKSPRQLSFTFKKWVPAPRHNIQSLHKLTLAYFYSLLSYHTLWQFKHTAIINSLTFFSLRGEIFIPLTLSLNLGGLVTPPTSRSPCKKYNVLVTAMLGRLCVVAIPAKLPDTLSEKSLWQWILWSHVFCLPDVCDISATPSSPVEVPNTVEQRQAISTGPCLTPRLTKSMSKIKWLLFCTTIFAVFYWTSNGYSKCTSTYTFSLSKYLEFPECKWHLIHQCPHLGSFL